MSTSHATDCQQVSQEDVGALRRDSAHVAKLIDERREIAARLAGKEVEICMALGDRNGALLHLKEMQAQVEARKAARQAGCYFVEQGEADRARMGL